MSNRRSDSATRGLEEGWSRAAEALKKRDAAAIAALFTEDATLIDPSMSTVSGRANLETTYRDIFSSTTFLDMTHEQNELTVSGDLAVESGLYTQTTRDPGKAPTSSTARYLMVWKYVDGRWLVLRDATIPLPTDSTQG